MFRWPMTGTVKKEAKLKTHTDPVKKARIDLHVHSRCSEASTEWFMERWGIAESYSDPFSVYDKALRAGMSMVTVTDHNSIEGSLVLKERFGDRVVTGVETTACFPEDGCRVHILVYGLGEEDFREIQVLRKDIYELRDYLRQKDLAHSVAHATYSVQPGALTVAHVEKLICLFNVFEVINGGRNRSDNDAWRHILERLTPECLGTLCRKHGLEPFDSRPWEKGFTAGSDDHGGIFIGKTFTELDPGEDPLESIRRKRTAAGGRHSDYQSLVFSVYKVMYDARKSAGASSLVGGLAEALFQGKRMGLANRFRMNRLKARLRAGSGDRGCASFREFAKSLNKGESVAMEERVRLAYSAMTDFSDRFLRVLFDALGRDMAGLDLFALVKNAQGSLPGIFLALPFALTLRHLNANRRLVERLASNLRIGKPAPGRRILWFTDTLYDLNGVSVTLQEVGRIAQAKGLDIRIATALSPDDARRLPANVINLPYIHEFGLPYYDTYRLKVPSMLASLADLYRFDPDAVHISTPGPIGLFGLLVARLMNVRSVGFYHTDFALQARQIVRDESVSRIVEAYTRWFYSAVDEIRVPTARYVALLERRGYDARRMRLFSRGIDLDLFAPRPRPGRSPLAERFGLGRGLNLLYVGRVSMDKGLDFLLDVYREVAAHGQGVNLLVVGDGPGLAAFKKRGEPEGVVFAGKVDHHDLPALYAASDLLVFPSTTDTFGRVVLEAQACGLPAVVSDQGGPQEIILHGQTGLVARAGDLADWKRKIERVLAMTRDAPRQYQAMRDRARRRAIERFDWAGLEDPIVDIDGPLFLRPEKKIA